MLSSFEVNYLSSINALYTEISLKNQLLPVSIEMIIIFCFIQSLIDKPGLDKIMAVAKQCRDAYDAGNFKKSTELWSETETVCDEVTGGVNFYNILDWAPNYSPKKEKEQFKSHIGISITCFFLLKNKIMCPCSQLVQFVFSSFIPLFIYV